MPSIPSVPLMRARPSLARSVSGSMPAAAERAAAPSTSEPSARRAWPSPSSTRALDARGARSPLAPSDPCSRTTGVIAAVQQGQHRLDDDRADAAEPHRQAAGAQERHRPHDLALDLRAHPGGVRCGSTPSAARPTGRPGSRCWRAPRTPSTRRTPAPVASDQPLDDGRAALDRGPGVGPERDRPVVAGDGDHVGGGDPAGPEHERSIVRHRAERTRRRSVRLPGQWRLTPPYFMRVSDIAAARASASCDAGVDDLADEERVRAEVVRRPHRAVHPRHRVGEDRRAGRAGPHRPGR